VRKISFTFIPRKTTQTHPAEALTTNWKVWPVIQGVNFSIVPLAYRLPFQQTAGMAWSGYLSLLNARCVSSRQLLRVLTDM
jgi:hypothetical protein